MAVPLEVIGAAGNIKPPQTAKPGAIFTVFVVAGLIGGITLIERGQLPQGTMLALLVFLIIGALLPPVAIIVGAIIIAYLLLTGGALSVFQWTNQLTSSSGGTQFTGPYAPLGPSVPGAVAKPASGPFGPISKTIQ